MPCQPRISRGEVGGVAGSGEGEVGVVSRVGWSLECGEVVALERG